MAGDERQPRLIHSVLAQAEESRLFELFDYLEEKIPAEYRRELLSFLLPRTLPRGRSAPTPPEAVSADLRAASPAAEGATSGDEDLVPLELYRALFARRGDTLLKALATILFAEGHLGVRWLTPMEITRILAEFDDSHRIYRSNVSNVLRKEKSLVVRRPRGRGYEYGLTESGRARVMRALNLLKIDR